MELIDSDIDPKQREELTFEKVHYTRSHILEKVFSMNSKDSTKEIPQVTEKRN